MKGEYILFVMKDGGYRKIFRGCIWTDSEEWLARYYLDNCNYFFKVKLKP